MKLLVKSLAGGNFHLEVEPKDTVGDCMLTQILSVKQQVEKQQGHATQQQKLIFSGKILEDAKTIQEYGIQEKDFLVVMVSKVRSGSHVAESRQNGAENGRVQLRKERGPSIYGSVANRGCQRA